MTDSLLQLIERVRSGDEEAVRLLVDQYGDSLRRVIRLQLLDTRIRRLVGESDVFQSVISRFVFGLWAGRYDFDNPQQLGALLRKIAKTCIIDATRHHTAQRRDVRRNEAQPEFNISARSSRTPLQIVADQEFLSVALEKLTETERKILQWRQEKNSWQEISDRLNEPSPEALRKRFERSINQVASDLDLGN